MQSRCMLVILASVYTYNEIMVKYRGDHIGELNFRKLWKMGFGQFNENSRGQMLPPWCLLYADVQDFGRCATPGSEMFHVLFAAFPQLIIPVAYVAMNYQLTSMIHLRDWTRLTSRPQPLRVTNPERGSAQVSTYWLSLLYRYGVPLLISSASMSWLVSLSLFAYRFVSYDNNGSVIKQPDYLHQADSHLQPEVEHGLGYSAIGVLCSIVIGVATFCCTLVLGLRKCPPGLPRGSTNSLIIAAACHPPDNDRDAARKMVMWGVIKSMDDLVVEDAVLHCSITSQTGDQPAEGCRYA